MPCGDAWDLLTSGSGGGVRKGRQASPEKQAEAEAQGLPLDCLDTTALTDTSRHPRKNQATSHPPWPSAGASQHGKGSQNEGVGVGWGGN